MDKRYTGAARLAIVTLDILNYLLALTCTSINSVVFV